MLGNFSVSHPPDADQIPNTEQVASAPGGAAAEPTTSLPPKTEETGEERSGHPDQSKVHTLFFLNGGLDVF